MHSILCSTAWDDGKIRAFYPESGKPAYIIHDAHGKGVTALAVTSNSRRIISGGGEGQVRVWDIMEHHQNMREALKEHKGEFCHMKQGCVHCTLSIPHSSFSLTGVITCIKIRKDDEEVCDH